MQHYSDVYCENDYTEPRSVLELQAKYSSNEKNEFIRRKLFKTDLNWFMSWDIFLLLVGGRLKTLISKQEGSFWKVVEVYICSMYIRTKSSANVMNFWIRFI